jgi:hypothetical protein
MTGQPGRSSSLERAVGDAGSSTTQPINATQEQGPPYQVESAGMQARPSSQRLSLDSAQSVGSTKQRASETKTETKRRRSLRLDGRKGKGVKKDLRVIVDQYDIVLYCIAWSGIQQDFSSSRLDALGLNALVRGVRNNSTSSSFASCNSCSCSHRSIVAVDLLQ